VRKALAERPLIFGYYSVRRGIPFEDTMTATTRVTAFASGEGFALAGMFVEPSEQPAVALQAMIESAHRRDVAAVVVPAMTDLGLDPVTRHATRERLEAAGIRLLVLPGGGAA
jgi:hypothetical protein